MRLFFGVLAVFLCMLSIALAARYGYKGADTVTDGAINAVVFGAIALCACVFDAAAVRLWFMRHRVGAVAIGIIASAALVVTFTNSLGAIAGRADTTQAERTRAKDSTSDNRADLKRIAKERADMPRFTPTDADAVAAARKAAATAERARKVECGDGDPKQRGKYCRSREDDEKAAADRLTAASTDKVATDRAAKLDADAAAARARLQKTPLVENANPLGAALEQIIGGAAAFLTAWQQAVVAAVFELCLVGVMVIYELLGQQSHALQEPRMPPASARSPLGRFWGWRWRRESERPAPAETGLQQPPHVLHIAARNDTAAEPAPRRATAAPSRNAKAAHASAGPSVKTFVSEHVVPAAGEQLDMRALLKEYREWCSRQGAEPKAVAGFAAELSGVCAQAGIKIETLPDKRVICLDVAYR